MNHAELTQAIKQAKEYAEALEQNIHQLENENSLSGTTKTQKDCNAELIGLWRNEINVLHKREGYLLALMEQPEQKEEKNFSLFNVRCTPNNVLQQ
ncbi:hypothetical protein bcgnr5378_66500 [Bacillus cereus]